MFAFFYDAFASILQYFTLVELGSRNEMNVLSAVPTSSAATERGHVHREDDVVAVEAVDTQWNSRAS